MSQAIPAIAGQKRPFDENGDEAADNSTQTHADGSPAHADTAPSAASGGHGQGEHDEGWTVVEGRSKKSKRRKKSKGQPHHDAAAGEGSYPALTHAPTARLQTQVKINDLQSLVLYLLSDGQAPQWIAVRNRREIRKVIVLMVPGLELDMLRTDPDTWGGRKDDARPTKRYSSPDDYYPVKLVSDELPADLQPLAAMFAHVWPIKAPGDDKNSRMHSPLQAMLMTLLSKAKDKEQPKPKGPHFPSYGKDWKDKPTRVTDYLASALELDDFEYVLHPALFAEGPERDAAFKARESVKKTVADGWVDTDVEDISSVNVAGDKAATDDATAGKKIFAIDCEMCKTEGDHYDLTRISVLNWNGDVEMDELVKPSRPIVDYLTQYSGMTREKLDPVTTSLADIQTRLKAMFDADTILVGHSLDSDLNAMRMTHPHIIDTAILFPHPRGRPLKSALKWLTSKYLSRDIQKGQAGHDSIEDARAALDLVKQKCQRGPAWGTSDASLESIFTRIGRSTGEESRPRTTAIVDWGQPRRGYGAQATYSIGCASDDDVVTGIEKAVNGDAEGEEVPAGGTDFVWARLRELEARRGWWTSSKTADNDALRAKAQSQSQTSEMESKELLDAVAMTVQKIKAVYDSLPQCTAFIVYTGQGGDPRELAAYQERYQQWRKEYNTKKWDQMDIQWTDTEEKGMKAAFHKARNGIGFLTVK